MSNIDNREQQLKYMKECIGATKTQVDQAKARKETHLARKEELEKDIRAKGVDPENIDNDVISIFEKVDNLMAEADSKIPYDLLRKLGKLPPKNF